MPRSQVAEQPTGVHWGEYANASALPNAASGIRTNHINRGDIALAGDELYVCISPGAGLWAEVPVVGGAIASLTVTGDIVAGGGFPRIVGPFTAPGAAGVTAADQTDLDCRYSHTVTEAVGFVAPRAGSIIGLSAQIHEAITGEGTGITVAATINGTEVALEVELTEDGGETAGATTAPKDEIAFAAGDVLGVSYTSTTITNTPALVASLEIEM